MIRNIHILILFIYLITSSFVIGKNNLYVVKDGEDKSISDILILSLTIPLSEVSDHGNEIQFLLKESTEDYSVTVNHYPHFIKSEYRPIHCPFHIEEKINDPLLNIFSPPPLVL